ncbi:MAG: FxsA family protein [Acidobacteriota bacterium]
MHQARIVRLPPWLFPALVVALTVVPLGELWLLVWMGKTIGWLPTFVLCASTGFLGAWLARWQGFRTIARAQQAMGEGRFPKDEVLDGALLLVGGVVLLTPGLFTDAVGFSLLVPPTRSVIKTGLEAAWKRAQREPRDPDIIDGSARVVEPDE